MPIYKDTVKNDIVKPVQPHVQGTDNTDSPALTTDNTVNKSDIPVKKPIGSVEVKNATDILNEYKNGKQQLEDKIVENEQFWKLRHWESAEGEKKKTRATGWLWNAIVSKLADMNDAYPEPSFLARAMDDEEEAKKLTSIVPVILDMNNYRETYSCCCEDKLKNGASCTGVFWDPKKHGGLGDISIKEIDLLNLFWQPGITDIQASRHVFHVEYVDNEILEQMYPELKDKLSNPSITVKNYLYDDQVEATDKSSVVDWYYHKYQGNRKILHYCKYVNDTVLFATENEPKKYPDGWYNHGQYPFVIDPLYLIKGSIVGYGITDIGKDTQIQIDLLKDAIVKNARLAAKKRFFFREDGDINKDDFCNVDNDLIFVKGNLGEDSIREFRVDSISGNYINVLQNMVDELKEITGNIDVHNGAASGGVTAASAITALQQAAGKTSRSIIDGTYNAFKKITNLIVELIRQFYNDQRQFRITGENGKNEYISYQNAKIKPQHQGEMFGQDMGYRLPCFDIEISAERANPYNRLSQNELAIQFFNLGFYNPQMADQALACLTLMDFDTKDKTIEIIKKNSTMYDNLMMFGQLAYTLAMKYEPQTAMQLYGKLQQLGMQVPEPINQTIANRELQQQGIAV